VSASTGYFLPGALLMFKVVNQQAGMLLAVAASGLPMPRARKVAGSEKAALIWHFIKHLVVRGQAIAQPPSRVESHEPKHSSCAYLVLRAERGGEAPTVVAVDGGKGLGDVLLEVDDGLLEAAVRVCEAEEGVEEAVGRGGGGAGEHSLGRRALPCVSGTREMRQAVKPVRRRGGSYAEGACACGCAVGAEAERTRTAVLYEFVSPLDEYCGPRGTNQRRCRTAGKRGTAAQNFLPYRTPPLPSVSLSIVIQGNSTSTVARCRPANQYFPTQAAPTS
jgi:hypothetical protein